MAEPLGPGGSIELTPEVTNTPVDIVELPQQPGIAQMEDGSALIGELPQEEAIPKEQIPFDANLAEFIEEDELGRISTDLSSSVKDDMTSREDWEKI